MGGTRKVTSRTQTSCVSSPGLYIKGSRSMFSHIELRVEGFRANWTPKGGSIKASKCPLLSGRQLRRWKSCTGVKLRVPDITQRSKIKAPSGQNKTPPQMLCNRQTHRIEQNPEPCVARAWGFEFDHTSGGKLRDPGKKTEPTRKTTHRAKHCPVSKRNPDKVYIVNIRTSGT